MKCVQEEAVGVHVPEEGDKVGQPEWRGAQRVRPQPRDTALA